jgi:Zn finger protein HypA/HybF involved in hydrogenase expression
MAATTKIPVVCNECGKQWKVHPNADPQCPKCGGVDFDVR